MKGEAGSGCVGSATNHATSGKVVVVVASSGIFETCCHGDSVEVFGLDHVLGDATGKFLNLGSYVAKEGVATPTADEHDGVHWGLSEVHGHSGARSNRMGAEVTGFEA